MDPGRMEVWAGTEARGMGGGQLWSEARSEGVGGARGICT